MKFQVTNTIDNTTEIFNTDEEVYDYIKSELDYYNVYELKEPYTEDDFIIDLI